MSHLRLLAGRDLAEGPEGLDEHTRRLGPMPRGAGLVDLVDLIDVIVRSGLRGRGGAAFPVGDKWRSVAARSRGTAVVVANGAEGEPQSGKDRLLMSTRPHLVLDGAFIAARAVHANQVVLYVGEGLSSARSALKRAMAERPEGERRIATIVAAPQRYVAGESSAAVHFVNAGLATPTSSPPRPHLAGVSGAPTLVQNVESLAHAALIARYGDAWYRSVGRRGAAGTILVTVAGGVRRPGVLEVESGSTVEEVVAIAGGATEPVQAVLVGGYFGAWVTAERSRDLPLDAETLRTRRLSVGCGVIGVLPQTRCGVCYTAQIMRYLAGESSAQCGPCFFGLRALSDACSRVAQRGTNPADIQLLHRWASEVRGRGACRHPDGAVLFLESALETFADDFARHPAHWWVAQARPA